MHELLALQRVNALLIGGDDRVIRCGHDAIEQARNLFIGLCDGALVRIEGLPRLHALHLPGIGEHRFDDADQGRGRLQLTQQPLEAAFNVGAAYRLAIAATLTIEAHIIGVALPRLAPRPVRGERAFAIIALDTAAKREVRVDVGPRGRVGTPLKAHLDFFEGDEIDQAVMLALTQRHAPFGTLDHPGVERVRQYVVHKLIAHFARGGARKFRARLEEAFYFRLSLEPARGVTLKPFLNDGGDWLVANEHLSATLALLIAETPAGDERPVPLPHPRFHPVARLLGILDTGMRTDRREKMFDKLAVAVLAEFNRGAFENAARLRDGGAQSEVRFETAREARNIVNENARTVLAVLTQEPEHGLHAGAIDQTARYRLVLENPQDGVSLHARKFGAARGLTFRALALGDLSSG